MVEVVERIGKIEQAETVQVAVYYQAPCEVGRRKEFLASDFRGAFLLR